MLTLVRVLILVPLLMLIVLVFGMFHDIVVQAAGCTGFYPE